MGTKTMIMEIAVLTCAPECFALLSDLTCPGFLNGEKT